MLNSNVSFRLRSYTTLHIQCHTKYRQLEFDIAVWVFVYNCVEEMQLFLVHFACKQQAYILAIIAFHQKLAALVHGFYYLLSKFRKKVREREHVCAANWMDILNYRHRFIQRPI